MVLATIRAKSWEVVLVITRQVEIEGTISVSHTERALECIEIVSDEIVFVSEVPGSYFFIVILYLFGIL